MVNMPEPEKEKKEEKQGSYAPTPEEIEAMEREAKEALNKGGKKETPIVDPNAPLFKKLDAIVQNQIEMKNIVKKGLNGINQQLCRIADNMGAPTGTSTTPAQDAKAEKQEKVEDVPKGIPAKDTIPTKSEEKKDSIIEDCKGCFPKDLQDKLIINKNEKADGLIIKLTGYLGSENFAKIAGVVRDTLNGEYISAGKASHFNVPLPIKDSTPEAPETEAPREVKGKPIEIVKMMFPQDLEKLLKFTEDDEYVLIHPRQYLGSENFAKIASILRDNNGEYISAGKESHFRVKK